MFTAWSEIKYLATKELLPCHYQIWWQNCSREESRQRKAHKDAESAAKEAKLLDDFRKNFLNFRIEIALSVLRCTEVSLWASCRRLVETHYFELDGTKKALVTQPLTTRSVGSSKIEKKNVRRREKTSVAEKKTKIVAEIFRRFEKKKIVKKVRVLTAGKVRFLTAGKVRFLTSKL